MYNHTIGPLFPTNKQGRKKRRPNPKQGTTYVVKSPFACIQNSHDWQPTLVEGLTICTHCLKVSGCRTCAPKTANPDMWGLCREHQGSQSTGKQEVKTWIGL